MKLSQHFSLKEFTRSQTATRFGINNTPSKVTIEHLERLCNDYLEPLRKAVDAIIIISSGYRCLALNVKIGGSKNSQHKLGKAADIRIEDIDPKVVYELIEYLIKDNQMLQGGLGKYKTFTHYDIRGTKARW